MSEAALVVGVALAIYGAACLGWQIGSALADVRWNRTTGDAARAALGLNDASGAAPKDTPRSLT